MKSHNINKISNVEYKVLHYLYHNKREPFTTIAKKTKLTRMQVEYAIKNFEKKGIIKKYMSLFNYSAFGFKVYVFLLLKFRNPHSTETIGKSLDKSQRCTSWGKLYGKFDMYANLIFKNEEEVNKYISEIINKEGNTLEDYLIFRPYQMQFFPIRKIGMKQDLEFSYLPQAPENRIKLDSKDIAILKELEKNGRERIIDIAKKTNLPADKVLYRIKSYEKNNIFYGARTFLDMKKIGYNYTGLILDIDKLTEQIKNDLTALAETNSSINAILFSLMRPNCFVQIFHKTTFELKEIIRSLNEILKNTSHSIDILLADEEDKVNTLPFL